MIMTADQIANRIRDALAGLESGRPLTVADAKANLSNLAADLASENQQTRVKTTRLTVREPDDPRRVLSAEEHRNAARVHFEEGEGAYNKWLEDMEGLLSVWQFHLQAAQYHASMAVSMDQVTSF